MEIMHKKKTSETASDEDNVNAKDVSRTEENDPWDPPYPPCVPGPCENLPGHIKLIKEWMKKKQAFLAASRATHTIMPDRTPEKIFLDTVRLIAERTDDILAELWNYMKDGKLTETAVLLLAAQKKIRVGSSFKRNANSQPDGFSIILNRCTEQIVAIDLEMAQNRRRKKQLETKKKLCRLTLLLVFAVSEAGEALDAYVRAHPEVPHAMQISHVEVLEHVSSILKNYGFFSYRRTHQHWKPVLLVHFFLRVCPYERHRHLSMLSDEELPVKHDDDGHATDEKGARKKQPRGWKLNYARRSYFLYRNSVLQSKFYENAYPMVELESIRETLEIRKKSAAEGSSAVPNNNLALLGRVPQLTSNHQSRRLFGTAASAVLKSLKHA